MRLSRGGLTTKLHALVDADERPVDLRLTGRQVYDACEAEALIEVIPEGAQFWAINVTTVPLSANPQRTGTSGRIFPTVPTANSASDFRSSSTNSAISSSASSTGSSSSAASPPIRQGNRQLSCSHQTHLHTPVVQRAMSHRVIAAASLRPRLRRTLLVVEP